ncbi:unnamed protein product [Prorocentrum cordatum]|uniref:Uncharacterized protein n=1 Tax=Prorocentrum cordatum TaxID=2364126 RepID=A0ABN9UNR0_9DINO|nr:unnamed protein product [Polarella glacialis]
MPNAWPLGAGEATARRQRGDGGATGRVRGWRSRRRRPRVCTNMAGCDTSARHTSSNTGAGRAGLRPCASELRQALFGGGGGGGKGGELKTCGLSASREGGTPPRP